jgi:hypothetical protein
MTTPVHIKDAGGNKRGANVTSGHALKVTSVLPSAADLTQEELTRFQYYSAYFSDLDDEAIIDLDVDGSADPRSFVIRRKDGFVLYVKRLRFIFKDEQMDMSGGEARRFASAASPPGLSTGLLCATSQAGTEVPIFNAPVKQMADFWQYADDFTAVTGALGAGEDFLSWDILFIEPIAITEGSVDLLKLTIQDDLTNINEFKLIASGYQEKIER